jgi:hypothetical protein
VTEENVYKWGRIVTFFIRAEINYQCQYDEPNSTWRDAYEHGFDEDGILHAWNKNGDVGSDPILGIITNKNYFPYSTQTFYGEFSSPPVQPWGGWEGTDGQICSDAKAYVYIDTNGNIVIDSLDSSCRGMAPANSTYSGYIIVGGTYVSAE